MAFLSRKRSLLQSQKLLRRERVWELIKIIFVVVLFGGLLWGVSALSFSSKLNVQTVLVTGNGTVPTEEVLKIVRDDLKGRNVLIFSRANIFWYPRKQIVNDLQYSFAWIDKIDVEQINLTTISIKIKERVPVAVWCGVSEGKPLPCKLIDIDGNLFAKAPDFDGAAYIKMYGPLTSASWRGAKFYSKEGLDHILDLTKNLPEIGFQPLSAAVINSNAYDVFVSGGAYISAQVSDAVPTIISNISSLLTQKTFAQSQMSNFSNLLYIDSRFGNKLFYKFKTSSTATTTTHE